MQVTHKKRRYGFFLFILLFFLAGEASARKLKPCIPINNYRYTVNEASWFSEVDLKDLPTHRTFAKRIATGKLDRLKDSLFPVLGHQLIRGKGDVLVYREYFPGWPNISDTESFVQISIYIPIPLFDARDGAIKIGGSSGVLVFFSEGTPCNRDFCYGYATGGTISYVAKRGAQGPFQEQVFSSLGADDGVRVKISVELTLISTTNPPEDCGRCMFEGDILFRKTSLSDIGTNVLRPFKIR